MSSPTTLPLSQIVDVEVFVSPQAPPQPTFNQGLIVGSTAVIPSVGAGARVRKYLSASDMLSDGFLTSSPEYIAATLYFGQTPAPQTLWVGRQNLTALNDVQPHAAAEGTGYVVGDRLTVVQGGATGGVVQVTSVGVSGNITGVATVAGLGGDGYSVANGLSTTGGTGTGAQVDIVSIGETPLVALQACRNANFQWWACMVTSAAKADHEAIAAFVQTMTPTGCYFYTTSDADALSGAAGNVFAFLKAANYNRVFGTYATTQGGAAPNNIYACAADMGVAMGLNTGLANSFFTMKFKQLTGVLPEPLSPTSIAIIEGNNGNIYLSYANSYTIEEQGVVANGQFFDEILNIDMLVSAIQFNVMNLLVGNPAIPMTDAGETQLIHAVNEAADAALSRGFIAGGVWKGVQILRLLPGQTLPKGYLAQASPFATQSTADHQARKAMPIYLAIIEAEAVHSIVIGVYVQR